MDPLPRLILVQPALGFAGGLTTAARRAVLLFAVLAPLAGLQAQSTYTTPYTFTTFAGTAGSSGSADGTGSAARFNRPAGDVAVDGLGNVFVADTYNHTIRKVTPGGVVTTLAGTAGTHGSADGTGSAAQFYNPVGVAVDGAGNLYVTDNGNNTIRMITSGGVVTTLAGTAGSFGSTDGTGSAARFNTPYGIAVDGAGNVYVGDYGNNTIRKITSGGVVTTLAGTAGTHGSADGTGSAARFFGPGGVAVDGAGNVYVADTINSTIRKITSGGVVTTLAGTAGTYGSTDGTGSAARFLEPFGVAVDGAGNVYVADTGSHTIRRITPAGVVTTLAGTAGTSGSTDGTGSAARFYDPEGVAVDPNGTGNIYVNDSNNDTIRAGVPPIEVDDVLLFKGTHFVQTSASGAVVDPKFPGPGYGGPYYFSVNIQGTGLSAITPPVITLASGSLYPSQDPTNFNGGTLFYDSSGGGAWRFGVEGTFDLSGGDFSGPTEAGRDASFAFGTYGMTVLGTSFSLNFTTTSYPVNPPSVTLTGGNWVGGKYVIDPSQDLTITSNAFTNFNQNTDGAMQLQVDDASISQLIFYSDNHLANNYVTYTIPGGTLTAGRDYRASVSFDALMDKVVVPALGSSLNAPVYEMTTRFVISAVPASQGGAQATFYGVGALSQNGGAPYSEVRDATKYGGVIYAIGGSTAYSSSNTSLDTGFLWTSTNGMTALPAIVNATSPISTAVTASAITPDGAFIASRALSDTSGIRRHAVEVTTSGLTNLDLGTLSGFPQNSAAQAISHDGSVLYGFARYATPGKTQAVRFTASGPTITAIPFLNGGDDTSGTAGRGTSSDGSVMVGTSSNSVTNGGNPDAPGNQAFRYIYPGTVSAIPFLSGGTWSGGLGVSPDGNLCLVAGNSTAHSGGEVYLYNASGSTSTPLGAPSGYSVPSILGGMTSDGSVVAIGFGSPSNASFIHNATGWHSLETVLASAGLSLPGWSFSGNNVGIAAISPDSTLLWGSGTHNGNTEGWVVEFAPGYLAGYGALADFNSDGHPDILWENTGTGERSFWLMNGTGFGSWVDLGVISTDWRIAAVADFNGDGKPDILWENTLTGDRGFYLMNGTSFSSWVDMGIVSTDWRIAGAGDFNGDGQPDILWENTSTGARGIYLMNGTSFASWADLGTIATALRIVGAGDFNGDGKIDILWENTSTGKRVIWLMNGTGFTSSVNLGIVSTDWRMVAVADFDGDGKADILWENTVSGDRGFWLMNGTTFGSWVDLGVVTTDWQIAN